MLLRFEEYYDFLELKKLTLPVIGKNTKFGFNYEYITPHEPDTGNNKTTLLELNNKSKKELNSKRKSNQSKISDKKNKKSTINKVLEDYNEYNLITLVGKFNNEDLLEKGSVFNIVKEPDNQYDAEAIAVKHNNETIAYVANSVSTVVKGTMSAGRIYDKFNNNGKIEIIYVGGRIIAKLIS